MKVDILELKLFCEFCIGIKWGENEVLFVFYLGALLSCVVCSIVSRGVIRYYLNVLYFGGGLFSLLQYTFALLIDNLKATNPNGNFLLSIRCV